MNPVAFNLFGIDVRWYGITMALGMLLGGFLLIHQAKKKNINVDTIYDLLLVVIPSAVVGARLYYVVFNWQYYQGDILKIINTRQGGMAIHGGIIFGVLAGFIFCKIKKLNFWDILDMGALGLILGQAIGRWGNFINQEAHGGPTSLPWGIMVNGIKVHPTFLYESLWDLLVLFVLWKYKGKKKFNGEVFMLYMILYSVGRFLIEGLRTDSLMMGNFRTAQVISALFIVIGLLGIFIFRKYKINKVEEKL
ncbi:prolipoprotein diacylglyceryl transferase [Helicovermis profundi]|uniref:Phosphatidylglycerol--prolipoprotein diacylglyceryl transferase n=1 Tax=Helicovermis profundi TaxID=3065157 RepID=A0AAU9EIU6_9FIRM|nr:prolipoprotein diacylglyceryl transferase [Clostridia bacterium S502]